MIDKRKEIESLIDKAAACEKSEDALRFSQAACNAANAMFAVKNATVQPPSPQLPIAAGTIR
jgi:hypothetical protein